MTADNRINSEFSPSAWDLMVFFKVVEAGCFPTVLYGPKVQAKWAFVGT
jgi:hypothetical protein